MADSIELRVVGGANVPTASLRVSATWPLAVLELVGPDLSLTLRWPARLIGTEMRVVAHELASVFPIKALWGRGVGFTTKDGKDFYFWTGKRGEVLDRLAANGWPVNREVQKPNRLWSGTP